MVCVLKTPLDSIPDAAVKCNQGIVVTLPAGESALLMSDPTTSIPTRESRKAGAIPPAAVRTKKWSNLTREGSVAGKGMAWRAPKAMAVLVWLMLKRGERTVDMHDMSYRLFYERGSEKGG